MGSPFVRIARLGLVVSAAAVLAFCMAAAPALAYDDVPADYPYVGAISDLEMGRIMVGFEDGSFRPDDPVIRMQFAKIVVLRMGDFEVSEADICPFEDVYRGSGEDFYPDNYVAVAAESGIVFGFEDGTYRPGEPICRGQAIAMLACALGGRYPGILAPTSTGSTWAGREGIHSPEVALAEANGLLEGLPLASLDPWGPMSRGEVAQILSNAAPKIWPPEVDAAGPDGTPSEARPYAAGAGWLLGSFLPEYDTDWVRFATVPDRTYRIRLVYDSWAWVELDVFSDSAGQDAVDVSCDLQPRYGGSATFTAAGTETLLRLQAINSPGGDGHEGPPSTCRYHLMVEEPATYQLSGRITDREGNPLPGVTVTLPAAGGTVTGSDGTYCFPTLLSGFYNLEAKGPGFLAGTLAIDLRHGDVTASDLSLRESSTVRLHVLDGRGIPASVWVGLWGDDQVFSPDVQWPDRPEAYVFSDLPPGSYAVQAGFGPLFFADAEDLSMFSQGETVNSETFELVEGDNKEITLSMPLFDLADPRGLAKEIALRGFWLDYAHRGTAIFLPESLPNGWYVAAAMPIELSGGDNPWVHRTAADDAEGDPMGPYLYDVAYTNGTSTVFLSFSTDGTLSHLPFDRSGLAQTGETTVGAPLFLGGHMWNEYDPAPLWTCQEWDGTLLYSVSSPGEPGQTVTISVIGSPNDRAAMLDMVEAMRCIALDDM